MEQIAYSNVKTGREYAFVIDNSVVVGTAVAKKGGLVNFVTAGSNESNVMMAEASAVFAKKFAETLKQHIAAREQQQESPEQDSQANEPKKRGRSKNPESKSARAAAIVERAMAEGRTRKETIDILINFLGLTPAGASTYYQNAKKALSEAAPAA